MKTIPGIREGIEQKQLDEPRQFVPIVSVRDRSTARRRREGHGPREPPPLGNDASMTLVTHLDKLEKRRMLLLV